tara:strand:- start:116 stop:385 length:270 start_codon:yes stop_codon:yes gene_type:complete
MWNYSKYLPIFHYMIKEKRLSIRYNLKNKNFEVYSGEHTNKITVLHKNKDSEKAFTFLVNNSKSWNGIKPDFTETRILLKKLKRANFTL